MLHSIERAHILSFYIFVPIKNWHSGTNVSYSLKTFKKAPKKYKRPTYRANNLKNLKDMVKKLVELQRTSAEKELAIS
jgi:hypothetical protein